MSTVTGWAAWVRPRNSRASPAPAGQAQPPFARGPPQHQRFQTHGQKRHGHGGRLGQQGQHETSVARYTQRCRNPPARLRLATPRGGGWGLGGWSEGRIVSGAFPGRSDARQRKPAAPFPSPQPPASGGGGGRAGGFFPRPHVSEQGRQREQPRQQAAHLRDPGHGFDLDGMDGEQQGPRARGPVRDGRRGPAQAGEQPPQEGEHEQHVGDVQGQPGGVEDARIQVDVSPSVVGAGCGEMGAEARAA